MRHFLKGKGYFLLLLTLILFGLLTSCGGFTPELDTYTVTYHGNGNTGGTVPEDSTDYQEGDTVTVLGQGDLVKTGYTFWGWNTASDGSGIDYSPGEFMLMSASNVVFYAKWVAEIPDWWDPGWNLPPDWTIVFPTSKIINVEKGKHYKTIQEAIDDAGEGNTIIVPTGTYEENIIFFNKNLTVQSTDPLDSDIVESTIIDGGGNSSVVLFESDDTSTLMGFTIQSGENNLGGGIRVFYSSPTIKDNIIVNNKATMNGGGIWLTQSSSIISGNTINGNEAKNNGGGIYLLNSSPEIENNTIIYNTADWAGGGILSRDSTPTIKGKNDINYNTAKFGAGIHVHNSDITLENNIITHNKATTLGGGILVTEDSHLLPDEVRLTGWGSPGGTYYRENIPKDDSTPTEPVNGPAGNIFTGNRHGTPLSYTEGAHVYFY